jgi:metallophosphoesterase (TIGR00282 family)
MNILCIGDVVGNSGCNYVKTHLPALKKINEIDFVIANGENSAEGNGITPLSAGQLFDAGVDVITTGNHVFRRREIYTMLNENPYLLRPANYPEPAPGKGYTIIDTTKAQLCIINLMGTVFMENLENPFFTIDRLLSELPQDMIIIMDIHAEATSEKKALAFHIDGKVTAVYGTHTHVMTADEEILPKGTGYITDIGMTGPCISVLGVDSKLAIERFMTKLPTRFANASGPCCLCGVIFEINNKTKKVESVKRIQIK